MAIAGYGQMASMRAAETMGLFPVHATQTDCLWEKKLLRLFVGVAEVARSAHSNRSHYLRPTIVDQRLRGVLLTKSKPARNRTHSRHCVTEDETLLKAAHFVNAHESTLRHLQSVVCSLMKAPDLILPLAQRHSRQRQS